MSELVSLGPGGGAQSEFMPGEGIRYRARVNVIRGGAYTARLVITGNGWYETHEAGPFTGSRTIVWGQDPARPLYTGGDAYPGKVSLTLEVRTEGGEPVLLGGAPQGYFTLRCPDLPRKRSEPISVGIDPWAMALSKDNRYLYVTSRGSGQRRGIITVIALDDWEIVSVLPDWEAVDREIANCQQACPAGAQGEACRQGCVETYWTLVRPTGVAPADLASVSRNRMVVADQFLRRIHVIDRAGREHWLAGHIDIPQDRVNRGPVDLSDVVATPLNELFATDSRPPPPHRRQPRVFRLNLDPPHNIRPEYLPVRDLLDDPPVRVDLDVRAPGRNLYLLRGVDVLRYDYRVRFPRVPDGRWDFPGRSLGPGESSLAMCQNPDPTTPRLYVLRGPGPSGDLFRPEPFTSRVYYMNLMDRTSVGVLYESSLWDMACAQKGPLRGRCAYVLDAYRGQVRLLNLESGILLRDCAIPVGLGQGRILEDPDRDRVYVINDAEGVVRYFTGE